MDDFTLELLHVADQEAGALAVVDAPNLSAVLNALKAEDLGNDGLEDNTLTVSSGDAFIPGLFYSASEAVFGADGIADIQIQNELGFQAIALGNHEFDNGTRVLSELITGQDVTDDSDPEDGFVDTVPQSIGSILDSEFAGTNFPYLSTNLDFSTDDFLAPLEVDGGQAPQGNTVTSSVIIDVNGHNIGVIGATTPTLASIANPGGVGINPQPFDTIPTPEQLDALAAEIQAEVDALLDANTELNKIIVLAHMQQISIEFGLAERLENVDIIVAGGSNTRLFDENDRPRDGDTIQGEYPTFITNAGGTITAVVNTDGSYKYVGRLVIDFDENGTIIPESYDTTVSGAYATDEQGVADLNAEGLIDPEVQEIADAISAQIIATESNVFGISEVFLNGNRSGVDAPEDPDGVRTQETNLGNLTADANLVEAKLADPSVVVSIKNGGGIRASIGQTLVPPGGTEAIRISNEEIPNIKPEGGISQNDIQTTLAFNNGLTLLTLTKQELVDVLEHGISAIPEVAGQFPQVSGVKFSYDPDLAVGDRIQNAGIFDENDDLIAELVRDGEIVGDSSETFRIVTLSFLADGGDSYPFPTGDAADRVDLAQEGVQSGDATFADDGTEQDAIAEFLLDNFFETAFTEADTGRNLDERIQNLNFRDDTVLGVTKSLADEFTVESGVTSVFLDLSLLETAAGLTLTGVDSGAEPFSDDFQVGFEITEETDFNFEIDPFTPVRGTIEHTGTVTFNDEVTVGDFSIGFDSTRVSEVASGFFVADTLEGNGLEILFDIGLPGVVETTPTDLTVSDADLLLASEFATALSLPDLTGADVGDARIDASLIEGETGEPSGIDFEGFASGTVITDQFDGATFSTLAEFGVMIFDTANVTGGDDDLASDTLGNVLIIAEDGDSSDADDAAQGGTIKIAFDELTNVGDITLLDIEEVGGKVTLYSANDLALEMFEIPALEDNSVQTIALDTDSVSTMEVMFVGSGAIAALDFISADVS